MAFLSSEDRFGPSLDKLRNEQPSPATYHTEEIIVAFPIVHHQSGIQSNSRTGTFGTAPRSPCTTKRIPASILTPSPMEYNPVKDGEFPKTYTTKQIHQHQKESLSLRLKKPTHKNHLLLKEESEPSSQYPVQNEEHSSPIKELTMADLKTSLGPGSYQVQDKDFSHPPITTKFRFSKEKRMNILDFGKIVGEKGRESPGPIYHPTNMDINKSILKDKDLTSVLVKAKSHASLVASSASSLSTSKQKESGHVDQVEKSYRDMERHFMKLEKKLNGPSMRASFQRFDPTMSTARGAVPLASSNTSYYAAQVFPTRGTNPAESYRRGPGSYEAKSDFDFSSKRPLKGGTFGLQKSRDLLTNMIAAGHVAHDSLGPGQYDPPNPIFQTSSYNIRYQPKITAAKFNTNVTSSTNKQKHNQKDDEGEEAMEENLSKEEIWKVLKQKPSIPVPGSCSNSTSNSINISSNHHSNNSEKQ